VLASSTIVLTSYATQQNSFWNVSVYCMPYTLLFCVTFMTRGCF